MLTIPQTWAWTSSQMPSIVLQFVILDFFSISSSTLTVSEMSLNYHIDRPNDSKETFPPTSETECLLVYWLVGALCGMLNISNCNHYGAINFLQLVQKLQNRGVIRSAFCSKALREREKNSYGFKLQIVIATDTEQLASQLYRYEQIQLQVQIQILKYKQLSFAFS